MTKWFAYIVSPLILIPCIAAVKIHSGGNKPIHYESIRYVDPSTGAVADTTPKTKQQKQQEIDDKKKIKEVTKAKHVPKPEKVDEGDAQKTKPKRQRRPPGMERPPEIPRRNGN